MSQNFKVLPQLPGGLDPMDGLHRCIMLSNLDGQVTLEVPDFGSFVTQCRKHFAPIVSPADGPVCICWAFWIVCLLS